MFIHFYLVKFITEQIPLELQRKSTLNLIFKCGKANQSKIFKTDVVKTLAKDQSNY